MNKINITGWNSFEIGKLFAISKPAPRVQTQYEEGDVPFVASGGDNNGVQKYCSPREEDVLEKGNCITVSPVDGCAFYQENDFLGRGGAGSSINLLRNEHLNKYSALFVCTMIRRVCGKYTYSQMCSASKLSSEVISLPSMPDGTPDWQYMENYIQQIEKKQRNNLQIINNLLPTTIANKALNKLSTKNWKSFRIGDLFEIKNGKGITKQEIFENPGNIPAIQSGEENFGRIGYIDIKYCLQKKYTISLGECLTVARSGSSGFVGYQEKQCVVGDSAKILEPKFISNTLRLLFIRTMLMVNKARYAYTDKVTKDNYAKDTIKLPVLSDGTPDWTYMEQYITMLMYKQARNLKQLA